MKIIFDKFLLNLSVILLIMIVFHIASPRLSALVSPEDEALRIQKAYEGFKDITGSFIQKSHIKDLKRTDTYKGRFYIKASKFRWEYIGDKPQTIYISKDTLIIYQKIEKQAYISKFDRSVYGQSPIVLLGGLGDIRRDFDISLKDGRLILKPKSQMGNISLLEVIPSEDEFPVKSLTIVDIQSNRTHIEFRDVKVNTGIRDSLFEFSPPEGVTVIRQ